MLKKLITKKFFLLSTLLAFGIVATVFSGTILTHEKKLYSQSNEELIIRDFFKDKKNGVFVDVGCADYKHFSTTYYLEKHLGWSGIGVDALPEYKDGYTTHRPNTIYENYIVTDHAGTKEPFYRVTRMRELSSTLKNYAQKESRGQYEVFDIPTITLTKLLDKNDISQIDFLSMDIEDSEPAALAGFAIGRFQPKLVCIEAHNTVRAQILAYFEKNNYERILEYDPHDSLNWYFKPKNKTTSKSPDKPK